LGGETQFTSGHTFTAKRRLFVACSAGTVLELLEVQLAGKKRMSAEAFLNGYQLTENELLEKSLEASFGIPLCRYVRRHSESEKRRRGAHRA